MRTPCVTRSGRQKRSDEHEIRYGSWWKPTSVRLRGVYRRFLTRSRSLFLFFPFLPQFPITALCPHHMSFTSNYRKLRAIPNARIKVTHRVLALPDPTGCRERSKRIKPTSEEGGCWRGSECLTPPNTTAASNPWRSPRSDYVFGAIDTL